MLRWIKGMTILDRQRNLHRMKILHRNEGRMYTWKNPTSTNLMVWASISNERAKQSKLSLEDG